jgi:Zn-dependent M28 family amino/carboxypeptidase
VRAYILSRISNISAEYPHVHFVSDLKTNISFAEAKGVGVYFEGTNILVKIDGSESESDSKAEKGGVLLSAHYDSVSTAPGTTDDGMAVVTLLQRVEFLAKRKGKGRRTVVVNINNGEEDGLHGAHA